MTEQWKPKETLTTEKMTSDLWEMKKSLREKGYEPDDFAVILVNNDLIFGEVKDRPLAGSLIDMKNPCRLFRVQKVHQGGVSVELMLLDFDLMDEGMASFVPVGGYYLTDTSTLTQLRYLALLQSFLEQKMLFRAKVAGLHLPDGGVRPAS